MNSTNEQTNEVSTPEFVSDLQGWYDNFLSGRRYYISDCGQVRQFIAANLLQLYGKEFPNVRKETLRFGYYPDFPNHLLGQLKYK